MSDSNLSEAVAGATNFLLGIHDDLRAMLTSLEAAMQRAGWVALPRPVTAGLGSKLRNDWVLRWCYRYFVPKQDIDTPKAAGDRFDRLVSVSWNLNGYADAGYDYATLLAAAVRFPIAKTADEVAGSWQSGVRTFRATFGRPGVVVLERPDYVEFWPHASAAAAVGFPLCELNSEHDLLTRLVQPLLTAEVALGGKP